MTAARPADDIRDRRKICAAAGFHPVGNARRRNRRLRCAVLFRKRPAYRHTVKHSIYVHHDHIGRGVGRLLMQELIDACAAAGFR